MHAGHGQMSTSATTKDLDSLFNVRCHRSWTPVIVLDEGPPAAVLCRFRVRGCLMLELWAHQLEGPAGNTARFSS